MAQLKQLSVAYWLLFLQVVTNITHLPYHSSFMQRAQQNHYRLSTGTLNEKTMNPVLFKPLFDGLETAKFCPISTNPIPTAIAQGGNLPKSNCGTVVTAW